MNETEFNEIADQTIENIQDAIDDSGADIDYDDVGGVLTLEFEDDSKIIFSKQGAMGQLWMATRTGGYHFDYDRTNEKWICDNGNSEELYSMLSKEATAQAGHSVTITAP